MIAVLFGGARNDNLHIIPRELNRDIVKGTQRSREDISVGGYGR